MKQVGRRKLSGKGKSKGRKPARMSATWEEHHERVKYQVALSTERFLHEHRNKIASSSGESVARNSYLAGMIDMLSIARGTFGFWGADQIVNELERVNRRFGEECLSARTEVEEAEATGDVSSEAAVVPQTELTAAEGGVAKAHRLSRRDPMFA